jgi:hypothetical protein
MNGALGWYVTGIERLSTYCPWALNRTFCEICSKEQSGILTTLTVDLEDKFRRE